MARTLAEVDADLAALEAWRANTVNPALQQAQTALQNQAGRLSTLEAAMVRVRAAWRALRSGQIQDVDADDGGVVARLQAQLSPEELRQLRWLLAERRKVTTR